MASLLHQNIIYLLKYIPVHFKPLELRMESKWEAAAAATTAAAATAAAETAATATTMCKTSFSPT
jgi:hypothetical protein